MSTLPIYEVKADLFRGLAHPMRIRVLELLAATDEVPVSDLLAETGLKAPNLSQHLAVLRRYGLIASERRASQVYCRLAHPSVSEFLRVARELLAATFDEQTELAAQLDATAAR